MRTERDEQYSPDGRKRQEWKPKANSRIVLFFSLNRFGFTLSASKDLPLSQLDEFVSNPHRDLRGMRVADLLGHHRVHTVKEAFATEGTEPLLS
ncbi:MAG TPA: hypothetical protein PKD12_07350 [Nitrospira sp.]|nr:hypothetical protein [Nitrospira sp.]